MTVRKPQMQAEMKMETASQDSVDEVTVPFHNRQRDFVYLPLALLPLAVAYSVGHLAIGESLRTGIKVAAALAVLAAISALVLKARLRLTSAVFTDEGLTIGHIRWHYPLEQIGSIVISRDAVHVYRSGSHRTLRKLETAAIDGSLPERLIRWADRHGIGCELKYYPDGVDDFSI